MKTHTRRLRYLSLLPVLLLLCLFPDKASAALLTGKLEVVNAPLRAINNRPVFLYEATEGAPILRGSTRTDATGAFIIDSPVSTTNSVFYVSVLVQRGVTLVSVLGESLPAFVTVNEITTVASSYAFAQFYRTGQIAGEGSRLYLASLMHDNIASSLTGEISDVLLNSPNADQTNSLRMVRSLANMINICVVNPRQTRQVLNLTSLEGQRLAGNTAIGLANLARDPSRNADALFQIASMGTAYTPALENAPDAWCVTVKVNDSGSPNSLIAGPANVAFDEHGFAWIPNNVFQGGSTSSNFLICLQPNGKPADGTDGSPVSPIRGGGLLGGGWGITVSSDGTVWSSNFGWGGEDYWPGIEQADGFGSITTLRASDGVPLSLPDGLYGGIWRAQAIEEDALGNIWVASFENNKIFVLPNGDLDQAKSVQLRPDARPFGISPLGDGTAWVCNSGGLVFNPTFASIALVGFNTSGELEVLLEETVGDRMRVIEVDSFGNAWFTSNGDNTVYVRLVSDGSIHGFQGGGMDGPWGLAIDGEDNIWVSNFGVFAFDKVLGTGRITKFAGANPATRPAGASLGDPISPDTGYTVPTAGEQVLLANGEPLRGPGGPPSFVPMTRQTSLQIDAAGNIWTINNWKPFTINDILLGNPGGDGVVIFVGIAPPPQD